MLLVILVLVVTVGQGYRSQLSSVSLWGAPFIVLSTFFLVWQDVIFVSTLIFFLEWKKEIFILEYFDSFQASSLTSWTSVTPGFCACQRWRGFIDLPCAISCGKSPFVFLNLGGPWALYALNLWIYEDLNPKLKFSSVWKIFLKQKEKLKNLVFHFHFFINLLHTFCPFLYTDYKNF